MKEGILAIFDTQAEYAMNLMEYINHQSDFPLEACVFTCAESLTSHAQNHTIEMLLMGEECNVVGICKENIRHMVLLSEGKYVREDTGLPVVYKFQSAKQLLQELLSILLGDGLSCGGYRAPGKPCCCLGFFSASGGSGKTSLALAVGQLLAQNEEVLYLNFELLPSMTFAGQMERTYDSHSGEGLSELLYYLKQGKENLALKVKSITVDKQGLSCLYPVNHYGDLYDFLPHEAKLLMCELRRSGFYSKIILDIGFVGETAWALLEQCNKIMVLQGFGDISDTKFKGLLAMLKAEGREELLEKFIPVQCDYEKKADGGLCSMDDLGNSVFGNVARTIISKAQL